MNEINVNSGMIQPEVPKVLENEQINVYVPNATNDRPGMASFDADYFSINKYGNVKFSKKVIDENNVLRQDVNDHGDLIGTGEILPTEEVEELESGLIGLANSNRRKLNQMQFDEDSRVEAEKSREEAEILRNELYENFKGSILVINKNASLIVDNNGNGSILFIGLNIADDGYGNITFEINGDEDVFGIIKITDDGLGNVVIGDNYGAYVPEDVNELDVTDDGYGNVNISIKNVLNIGGMIQ